MSALPGACTTTLTYSTKLVKAGHVTFEYQYSDPETIFHFIVSGNIMLLYLPRENAVTVIIWKDIVW